MARVMRIVSLFSVVFLMVQISMGLAQVTATPQVPVEVDPWRSVFSIIVPLISMFGGPLLTKYIGTLPDGVKYAISAVIGLIASVLGSEFTSYPMHPDAAASSGVAMSLAGQKLLHMNKEDPPAVPPAPTT